MPLHSRRLNDLVAEDIYEDSVSRTSLSKYKLPPKPTQPAVIAQMLNPHFS